MPACRMGSLAQHCNNDNDSTNSPDTDTAGQAGRLGSGQGLQLATANGLPCSILSTWTANCSKMTRSKTCMSKKCIEEELQIFAAPARMDA